jgi:hypothetical protein
VFIPIAALSRAGVDLGVRRLAEHPSVRKGFLEDRDVMARFPLHRTHQPPAVALKTEIVNTGALASKVRRRSKRSVTGHFARILDDLVTVTVVKPVPAPVEKKPAAVPAIALVE